jgi:signal transduction histidine kinase
VVASAPATGARPFSTTAEAAAPEPIRPAEPLLKDRRPFLVIATLTALTLPLLILEPDILVVIDQRLDVGIASATLATGIAAALGTPDSRSNGGAPLFRASMLLMVTVAEAVTIAITSFRADMAFGLDPAQPGQAPLYFRSVTWIGAAVLSVIAVEAARGRWSIEPRGRPWVHIGPLLAVVGMMAFLLLAREALPALADPDKLARLTLGDPPSVADEGSLGPIVLVRAVAATVFVVAAWRALNLPGRPSMASYLPVALLVAALAEIHGAFVPGVHAAVATSADLLHAAFPAILLVGAVTERPPEPHSAEVARAREEELSGQVAQVALDERARLAREVHDGLAQELWYAKIKQDRLCQAVLDPAARQLCRDVGGAIDRAIADAQEAILALRATVDGETPFAMLAASYVEDFSARFDVPARFASEGPPVPVPARVQAELLRIIQESLSNVRKHAEASSVLVRSVFANGRLSLSIVDNGRGFDPQRASPMTFGLQSMRDRSAAVGGTFSIVSQPFGGTQVLAIVPLAPPTIRQESA